MKGKWFITLTGSEFDLQVLTRFTSPPEIEIKKDGEKYYLNSEKFNDCKEAREVASIGKEIINIINGIAKLHIQNWGNIAFDNPIFIDATGKKQFFLLCEPGEIRLRGEIAEFKLFKADGTVVILNEPNVPESTLKIANKDFRVEKALRIYGSRDHNWSNLYIIYEIIDEDVGGKSVIVNNGWASRKKIEKFHNTANNSNTIGDDARHHNPNRLAPSKPMTILEAKSFISDLLKKWIATKT